MARRREIKEEAEKVKVTKSSLKQAYELFKFTLPYKWTFIIGMIFLALSSATVLAFPFFAGKLVDVATGKAVQLQIPFLNNFSIENINQVALVLILILIAQSIFSYLRIYLFAIVSQNSMADIRKALYNKLVALKISFFEERRVGELTSRITTDVSQLQDMLSITLAEFIRQIATLVIGVAIISFTSGKLTLAMLATFPVMIIIAIVFGKFIRKISKQAQDALADSNVIVDETLQSIQVVKAFTNEVFESFRYGKSQTSVVDLGLKAARFRGVFVSFIIFALFGGIVFVLWYGASLVEAKQMSIGDLTAFIIYTAFIGGSVGGLGDLYAQLQKTLGASERVREILDMESEVNLEDEKLIKTTKPIDGTISFNNVQFSYPTRQDIEVLKGINLSFNGGQKVALVGSSGAGKSTIIQLLMRLYAIDSGEILIDGKSISDYNITALRSQIGIVPQEVLLFGGTIKENISYGKPNATEEEIMAAANQANAFEFINKFPEGFETIVGERGVKLSGGQRQRIAIARAILKDPSLLILDEATSSLDAESEHLVQGALNNLMQNRTTVIIAHRLSTIKDVDTIFVLDNGKIVEKGNHDTLIQNTEGIYHNLQRLQLQGLS